MNNSTPDRKLVVTLVAAFATAVMVGLTTMPRPVQAEDIDLFLGSSGSAAAPNVHVLIDNSGNWNSKIEVNGVKTTKKEMEHQALEAVFTDPALAGDGSTDNPVQIRLGLGLFSHGNSPKGGKVWSAVQDLTETHQGELDTLLDYFVDSNDPLKTNNAPYALSFHESHAYFSSSAPVAGTQDGERVVNDDGTIDNPAGYDPNAIASDGTYQTPAAGNCGKNYMILIGNGEPDSGEDNDAEDNLTSLGGVLDSDPIDVDPSNFASNWSDEYARFMSGHDVIPADLQDRGDHELNVRTYVIDVHDPDEVKTKKEKAARSWLKSIAKWGDGLYFTASSTDEIKDALNKILNELMAVNDVFAASTLPVSVNVRGTNLNQVYMGQFRPDAENQTRWMGNLKLYQLDVDSDTNTLYLADKNDDPAQSPATGFIKATAESFWTHSSSYWDFDPRGDPASGSDLPDGYVVEKGGAHQQIRDEHGTDPAASRVLYTTDECTDCTLVDFGTEVTASELNVTSSERDALVDWIHGANNVTDDSDPDTKTDAEIRPSVHGDVLHARPAIINYGDIDGDGKSDVFGYYGANDGIIHAVRGGKEGDTEGDGEELWGFIPPEFYGRLKHLRDNTDGKEYFADGSFGVYKKDVDGDGAIEPADGDKVHIYPSMRRGGRHIYALDVSDPSNPRFLWRITPSRDGYSELGQTWSHPSVEEIRYTEDDGTTVTKPVLVFGAGYDPETDDNTGDTTDSDADGDGAPRDMGRGIFVVDALTGDPIWQAGSDSTDAGSGAAYTADADMTYSIPSDVAVVDRNGDSYADRVYVGDTGGQVWRADISGQPSDWALYKLASIGAAAGLEERRFLYPPDVVYNNDADGGAHDAVLMGTGDRTKPFKTSVTNRFYMFKDFDQALTVDDTWDTRTEDELYDATDNLVQVGTTTEQETAEQEIADAKGWYITLSAGGSDTGEKLVSSPVTLGGTTFFNTNEPPDSDDPCANNMGIARTYQVDFEDASATTENNSEEGMQTSDRYGKQVGGGFPPSPVPVIVEIDGKLYETVIIGSDTKSPPSSVLQRRYPVYRSHQIDG